MRVAIDIRPLLEERRGGVSIYAAETVRALAARAAHRYALFSNARRAVPADVPPESADVTHRFSRYPNRLFNASLAFFGRPKVETLTGDVDCVWLPNLNFVATDKPLAVTVHDLSFIRHPRFFSAKQRLWHRLVDAGRTLRRADAVVAVSAHTKADVIETFGIPAERIHVAHPAADARFRHQSPGEIAHVRAMHRLPERFFLYLGALEPRKNIVGIIDAFDRLSGDEELVIAGGGGWLNGDIFRRAAASPRAAKIRFLGYVDEADKPGLYAASLALVYPSFYEGFGMPPLEAMAVGTPVIASHVTSLGEVVGDAGLLVDPYVVGEIAAAMSALASEPELASTLRKRGFARAKRFTWDESAARLERIFTSLAHR
jgi:glycosyltransferase involved in cell wall biosynthesis